jgi:hypothetical protein
MRRLLQVLPLLAIVDLSGIGLAGCSPVEPVVTRPPVQAATAPAPAAPAPAESTGSGKEFDREAAMFALSAAAGAARGCKKAEGPTGTARVRIVFSPSGSVQSASVEGPPFAGTAVGTCIAAAFFGAHVPAFDGKPQPVSKSVTIE